jgi:hypothetical protein
MAKRNLILYIIVDMAVNSTLSSIVLHVLVDIFVKLHVKLRQHDNWSYFKHTT